MKNFIPVARTDRLREMQGYEKKGYSFIEKKQYRMLEKIQTLQEGYQYTFGIEVTQNDIYFYMVKDLGNIYFSIEELYYLLLTMSRQEGLDRVLKILKKQMRIKIRKRRQKDEKEKIENQEKFRYRSLEYDIRKTVEISQDGELKIPDISLKITYCELFMLINLIQEKSNILFGRTSAGKCYIDGILRLFVVLLWMGKDDALLSELGWHYDAAEGRFQFREVPEELKTERGKRKYYLTKTEYINILK